MSNFRGALQWPALFVFYDTEGVSMRKVFRVIGLSLIVVMLIAIIIPNMKARFEMVEASGNTDCSTLLDFCVTVSCEVKNVGGGTGTPVVTANVITGKKAFSERVYTYEMEAGSTASFSHDFEEVSLFGAAFSENMVNCVVEQFEE